MEFSVSETAGRASLDEGAHFSIHVLLLDQHRMIGEALSSLIQRQPGFTITGQASDMAAARDLARREQPDIILMNLHTEDHHLLELLPDLLATAPKARLLILTGVPDMQVYYRAVRSGAMGLVFKQNEAGILFKAIEKVSAGEAWLDRSVTASLLTEISSDLRDRRPEGERGKLALLTRRERQVIQLVCEGMKNKQIATTLFISEATVTHHLTSIFSKLGVRDRSQLIVFAYRHGFADPNS